MAAGPNTTLYLRGVPRAVVREAKAAAARQGVTLGAWVTARIRSADPAPTPPIQDGVDIADDLAHYEAHRAEFERRYGGKYIAIIDRAVVDHDSSFEALAARVFREHGLRPVCMPLVGRASVRVRSPRRVAG